MPQHKSAPQLSPQKLSTPCVVIDDDIVERNLQRVQAYFDKIGVAFRPHIKTHKLPSLAKRQLAAGAVGINCQKISEAIPFVDAGIQDILISYNIIGDEKLAALLALSKRCDLSVTADSVVCVQGLAKTFAGTGQTLKVLVEVESGSKRCGVVSPEEALEIAQLIEQSDGLEFLGIMTYPPAYTEKETESILTATKDIIENAGIDIPVITSAGTPSIFHSENNKIITEHRAGTYIYCDRATVVYSKRETEAEKMFTLDDCALTIQATVVSVPTDDRCVIDAGAKALSYDLYNNTDYGHIKQFPEAIIRDLSEEHGHVDISACPVKPKIGDVVNVIPNHCCLISNLYDHVNFVKNGQVVETVPVASRGCMV